MNLVLHGIEDFQVVREDTLRSPAFTDSTTGGLATFDCVIANPPFSLKEWGRDLWEADPWGRAAFGLPPESYGDFAWVQHMVASMATRMGRMAVVLPQGALFRKDAEGRIRRALLEQDLIEAVIGLAPNIFYGGMQQRPKREIVIIASSLHRLTEQGVSFVFSYRQPSSRRTSPTCLPSCRGTVSKPGTSRGATLTTSTVSRSTRPKRCRTSTCLWSR
jgi:hypothetical protein